MSCKAMHLRCIPWPRISQEAEVQRLVYLRKGLVVVHRHCRLRSLKIQTNVRNNESNFTFPLTSVAADANLAIPVSCS